MVLSYKKIMETSGDIRSTVDENEILDKNTECKDKSIAIIRYETFIGEIENKIIKNSITGIYSALSVVTGISILGDRQGELSPIELIYDFNKINDFAKVIIYKTNINLLEDDSELFNTWGNRYDRESLKDEAKKINATRDFIKLCKGSKNEKSKYKFIFWSLMVLTVDKTDAEEKLSLICDFAKMLDIKDDEMRDIVNVIKYVYDRGNDKYRPKTVKVSEIFKGIYETEDNE